MPVEARWNTHLAATNEGWWLDPRSKDFGPNAKYFTHDVAEAKKLLAAAGFPNGFETISSYVTSGELPTAKHAEIIDGFMSELGLKSKVNGLDYATQYIRQYRDGNGQYEGWAYMSTAGAPTGGDAVGALSNQFWSRGGAPSFHGFSISGKNDKSGDPQVDAMIEKARVELDTEKRRALVFEIQRYLAKPVYSLLPPGPGTGFTVAWPALGNFRVYQGARLNHALWVDDTKPPLRPA
jgi:peptide/nickel transport system substrate-binding protein